MFINYTSVQQKPNARQKTLVSRHIGTHFRNRSRPSARLDAGHRPFQDFISLDFPLNQDTEPETAERISIQADSFDILYHDGAGLRQNPFAIYPINSSPAIDHAVDHFIRGFGPTHMLRPETVRPSPGARLVSDYFTFSLQHAVMFEAMIALSLADSTINTWVDRRPSLDVLRHYSHALTNLRTALLDVQQSGEDALILAIMSLMGVDYLLGNLNAFRVHLDGIGHIVRLRGGIDSLGWQAVIKPGLTSIEHFSQYLCPKSHVLGADDLDHLSPPTIIPRPMTDLRIGKTSTSIQALATKLPNGFCELLRRGYLSSPLIQIICDIIETEIGYLYQPPTFLIYADGSRKFLNFQDHRGSAITTATTLRFSERVVMLLAASEKGTVERLCCIGLFFYLIGFTRAEQFSPLYERRLNEHTEELIELLPIQEEADEELKDLTVWAAFVVASTLLPTDRSSTPARKVDPRRTLIMKLVGCLESDKTWDEVEAALSRFLTNTSCMKSWKALWAATTEAIAHQDLEPRICT